MSVLVTLGDGPHAVTRPRLDDEDSAAQKAFTARDRVAVRPGPPASAPGSASFGKGFLSDKFRPISWNSGNTFHLRRRAFDQTRVPPHPTPDAPEPHDLVVRWADRTSHR